MGKPLAGPDARIRQARKRADELHAEGQAFWRAKPYPYSGFVQMDKNRWHWLRVKIHRDIPDSWGLIVSEIGHHLRAALNEIVTDLSILDCGKADEGGSFPLYSVERDYRTPRRDKRGRSRPSPRDEYLALVDERHRTIIDRYQPFNDPLMADLQSLSNIDKHHRLEVGLVQPTDPRGRFDWGDPPSDGSFLEIAATPPHTWINDGAVLFGVRTTPHMDVKMEAKATLVPAFGKRRVEFNRLSLIINHVVDIIEVVRPEFGRPLTGHRPAHRRLEHLNGCN